MPATESDQDSSSSSSPAASPSMPPAKRPHESQDAEDAPPKRPKTVQALPSYRLSQEFWYPEGNIVVIVAKVGHKLYLSRLKKYCKFFMKEFPDVPEQTVAEEDGSNEQHSEARQNYVLSGVSIADFVEVLRTLETPLRFNAEPMSQLVALSLLRAGTRLKCDIALDAAKGRLRELWPTTPPDYEGQNAATHPKDVWTVIDTARKHGVPEVLKRALYALLLKPSAWERPPPGQKHARPGVQVPTSDVLMLYHARHVLQREWQALLFVVPGESGGRCVREADAGADRCRVVEKEPRAMKWRSTLIHNGFWDKGAGDVIGYAGVVAEKMSAHAAEPAEKRVWCTLCLHERRAAFLAAREKWWGMLDELFGLPQT
ncbi:hypothetical protein GY45DRAFT_1132639 [Cubamyces sp. BRFM 1775]|nr:hypothetical protein GY45DRAFT_1132639 [Cubamyces sp. BRFM 1775]